MKTRIFIILILTLLMTVAPFVTEDVYGAEYVKGQSIVAEDQEKASRDLNSQDLISLGLILGLTYTVLFTDGYIQ